MRPKHLYVTLTDTQRLAAIRIGNRVSRYADRIALPSHFNQGDWKRYPRGYMLEVACAEVMRVDWEPIVGPEGDWKRGDLRLRKGTPEEKRLQVRASKYPSPCPPHLPWGTEVYCHAKHDQDVEADKLYVFGQAGTAIHLESPVVLILGWYEGALIPATFKWSHYTSWGKELDHPAFLIYLHLLHDIEDLLPGGRYGEVERLF